MDHAQFRQHTLCAKPLSCVGKSGFPYATSRTAGTIHLKSCGGVFHLCLRFVNILQHRLNVEFMTTLYFRIKTQWNENTLVPTTSEGSIC